jgi:hypothetical protein
VPDAAPDVDLQEATAEEDLVPIGGSSHQRRNHLYGASSTKWPLPFLPTIAPAGRAVAAACDHRRESLAESLVGERRGAARGMAGVSGLASLYRARSGSTMRIAVDRGQSMSRGGEEKAEHAGCARATNYQSDYRIPVHLGSLRRHVGADRIVGRLGVVGSSPIVRFPIVEPKASHFAGLSHVWGGCLSLHRSRPLKSA